MHGDATMAIEEEVFYYLLLHDKRAWALPLLYLLHSLQLDAAFAIS